MAHRAPCLAALERGLGVYLEKPVARTLEDARAIADAARAPGRGRRGRIPVPGDRLPPRPAVGRRGRRAGPAGLLQRRGDRRAALVRPTRPKGAGRCWSERATTSISSGRSPARWSGYRRRVRGSTWPEADRPPESDIDDVVHAHPRVSGRRPLGASWSPGPAPGAALGLFARARNRAGGHSRWSSIPASPPAGLRDGAEVSLPASAPPIRRGLERFLDPVRGGDPSRVACDVEAAAGTLDGCARLRAGAGVRREGCRRRDERLTTS